MFHNCVKKKVKSKYNKKVCIDLCVGKVHNRTDFSIFYKIIKKMEFENEIIVKYEGISACRTCLATNLKLFDLQKSIFSRNFSALTGIQVRFLYIKSFITK